jgi:hypothetical protein
MIIYFNFATMCLIAAACFGLGFVLGVRNRRK